MRDIVHAQGIDKRLDGVRLVTPPARAGWACREFHNEPAITHAA